MKNTTTLLITLLTGATLGWTVGCTVQPVQPVQPAPPPGAVAGEVEVPMDPPADIMQSPPSSPGLAYVWVGGSWVWNGAWVWEPGRWQIPPHPGAVWVPHRYENRNGRHVFIRGGWR
jgi:hypothetical protein